MENRAVASNISNQFQENISDYVAQLQLHMALQARNLLPSLNNVSSNRHQLLHNTQATVEKLVSRQSW